MAHRASDHDSVLHSPRAYDLLVRVLTLGRERRFRERIVELARVEPGESALDVGCGTGGECPVEWWDLRAG
jgi:ubiquinone/menaquinone biosynthesis C-methylase UbiE